MIRGDVSHHNHPQSNDWMKTGQEAWVLSNNEFGNQGDKTMPDDRQGGQGTQKSGEKNDQQMNDKIKQPGQQPEQGKGRQDQQQGEQGTPGGKQGNS